MNKSHKDAILSVALMTGLILVAYAAGIVLCPLKRLTGIPCPTCGATRAVLTLVQGQFVGALQINPLVIFVLCTLPVLLRYNCRLRNWVWAIFAVAVLCNWAYVIFRGN